MKTKSKNSSFIRFALIECILIPLAIRDRHQLIRKTFDYVRQKIYAVLTPLTDRRVDVFVLSIRANICLPYHCANNKNLLFR